MLEAIFRAILSIPALLVRILFAIESLIIVQKKVLAILPKDKPLQIEEKPKMLDMKEYQIQMEELFHKNQLFPRIRNEFIDNESNFRRLMTVNGIDPDFGFNLMVQMVLHKRTKLPILVGILRNHYKGLNNASQLAADEIFKCVMTDLLNYDPNTQDFIIRFDITQDIQDDLDRYQFPLPMIVKPLPLENNKDTGYFTEKGSIILRDNYHTDDLCLDHLNKMNGIQFTINHDTAVMVHNQWKSLDKPKPDEDYGEYQKRVKAFNKYDRTARDVMSHLEIAGNIFYLTHNVDKRGRIYCRGYHVDYQGNQWNKAVIEFVDGEILE